MFVNLSLPFDDQAVSANAALCVPPPEEAQPVASPAGGAAAPAPGGPEPHPAPEDPPPAPEDLHPALWRADQLGGGLQVVTASGFAVLDAELPGGGWPHRMLTELLLPHAGLGEMRLLAPALAAIARSSHVLRAAAGAEAAGAGRCVMLFDPPAGLHAGALAALGLDARQWLVVRGRNPHGRPVSALSRPGPLQRLLPSADVLWALEQALKSGHAGAILAWLPPPLKADALRRLQLAAQAHDGPAFVFREMAASQRPSPAPLRLQLQSAGVDRLRLQLLKRRGPPLQRPLSLRLVPVLGPEEEDRLQQQQGAESALAWRLQHAPQASSTAQARLAALNAMAEQMARLPADPSRS
ncbi:translesion DNA synthesis-associated protein ImuA [Aquabacterium sp.]|uniref:translesion DNA synthesis-associated protein ImuA n=1 Tax=Aquabacterium sp. TaxID=1872578 RepID=UPI0037831467